MSIIYDALKKVKASPTSSGETGLKKGRPQTNTYVLYLILIIMGIFAAKLFFGFLKPAPKLQAQSQTQPQTQPAAPAPVIETKLQEEPLKEPATTPMPLAPTPVSQPTFTLNGIFFSGEEGYALINNQICKVGDGIDGALVEKITLEEVELKTFDGPVKLFNRNK